MESRSAVFRTAGFALAMWLLPATLLGQPAASAKLKQSEMKLPPGTPAFLGESSQVFLNDSSNLQLLDSRGQIINEIAGNFAGRPVASRNGRVIAALERLEKDAEEEGTATAMLRLVDLVGKQTTSFPLEYDFDAPLPHLALSPAGGQCLVVMPGHLEALIISKDGRLVRKTQPFGEVPFIYDRPVFVAALAQGFAILTNPNLPGTENSAPVLVILDERGREAWRTDLSEGYAGGLVASFKTGHLAVSRFMQAGNGREESTVVFNQNGKIQCEIPIHFRHAAFVKDGGGLVIASRHEVRLYQTATGAQQWIAKLAQGSAVIHAIAINGKSSAAAVLTGVHEFEDDRFVFRQGELTLLDSEGRRIGKAALRETLASNPQLAFDESESEVLIAAEGVLLRFQIHTARDSK